MLNNIYIYIIYIYKALRKIWRMFFPKPSWQEQRRIQRQKDYEYLISKGVETQPGYVTLYGQPMIFKHPKARIVLGKGVVLLSRSEDNYAGVNHPVILAADAPDAEIILHDGVGMSGSSIVAVEHIEIGENTMLGANTNVYDTDFHPVNPTDRIARKTAEHKAVNIGRQCWLGCNTTVLKGVTIGDRTTVGAMSLVTKDLPCDVVAGGVPAKVLKPLK